MENNGGMGGAVGGVALAAALGFVGWKVVTYLDKDRSEKATKEANEKALAHTVSTMHTKQRIAKLEQNSWRSGSNGYGKNVTVNVASEAKDAIRAIYSVYEFKGITRYARKSKSNMKLGEFVYAILSIPLSALSYFSKLYTIHTGVNILDDAANLDPNNYARVKAAFKVSKEKYPNTWK